MEDRQEPRGRDAAGGSGQEKRIAMRPIRTPSGIEYARRLMELGSSEVERREDGRLWAPGVDRRAKDR